MHMRGLLDLPCLLLISIHICKLGVVLGMYNVLVVRVRSARTSHMRSRWGMPGSAGTRMRNGFHPGMSGEVLGWMRGS